MQCLHSAYNLSQQYNSDTWQQLWTLITGEKGTQVKFPVMTRWECVGDGVDHVTKHKEDWITVSTTIAKVEKSNNVKYTIASHLYSLLNEPLVMTHLYFLKGY